jgi:hypothetical protein
VEEIEVDFEEARGPEVVEPLAAGVAAVLGRPDTASIKNRKPGNNVSARKQ